MNNAVTRLGKIIGYRCWTCREIYDSMWGVTCNKCRQQQELLKTLKNQIPETKKLKGP